MSQFQRKLTALKGRVAAMGVQAASMFAVTADALVKDDRSGVPHVLATEPSIDRFQIEIDGEAIRLITIYTPVARDLRLLLMIARVTSELERIGDQAVDNCEYLALLAGPSRPPGEMSTMAEMVLGMVWGALQAFQDEDTTQAKTILGLDSHVDALNASIFRALLEPPPGGAGDLARRMSLGLLARSLERVADHATNICEEVIYLVEGADIRHPTPGVIDAP